MVVLEHSAQAFATANGVFQTARGLLPRREQQNVALALTITLLMIVRQVVAERVPQRTLPNQDQL